MTTFATNPGVDRFETGGPDGGLLTVVAGTPFQTDDPAVIAVLREHGAHAVSEVSAKRGGES